MQSAFRLALLGAFLAGVVPAPAMEPPIIPSPRVACSAPAELVRLGPTLPRLAERVAARQPVTIVALGSSSTAGAGATGPAATYPARLEVLLAARIGVPVRVINRGVNGEDVPDMLRRLDRDVLAEKPDLVIWQFGTNALLRENGIGGVRALAAEGLKRLVASGADLILLDPQYAPRVTADPDAPAMVAAFDALGSERRVPVFHRFAVMRHWHETRGLPYPQFLAADGFHMNDWSYNCLAELLTEAIVEAVSRPAVADRVTATPAALR